MRTSGGSCFGDRPPQFIRPVESSVLLRSAHDDGELLSADPRNKIALPDPRPDEGGQTLRSLSPRGVRSCHCGAWKLSTSKTKRGRGGRCGSRTGSAPRKRWSKHLLLYISARPSWWRSSDALDEMGVIEGDPPRSEDHGPRTGACPTSMRRSCQPPGRRTTLRADDRDGHVEEDARRVLYLPTAWRWRVAWSGLSPFEIRGR